MKIVLLAPPGAGKGTQGHRLAEHFGARHIATGDLLRAEIRRDSPLGGQVATLVARGDLVADDLVLEVMIPVVRDAVRTGGYVLDGFPRTLPQAQAAYEAAKDIGAVADVVVYLNVGQAELVRRLLARAQVQGRADDTAEVIGHRLAVYAQATRPLLDYYADRGLVLEIDGEGAVDAVNAEMVRRLSDVVPSATTVPMRKDARKPS